MLSFSHVHGKNFLVELEDDGHETLADDYVNNNNLLTKKGQMQNFTANMQSQKCVKMLTKVKRLNILSLSNEIINYIYYVFVLELGAVLDALSEPEIEAYKSLNKTLQERLQRKIRAAYGEDVDAVSIPHAVMLLSSFVKVI